MFYMQFFTHFLAQNFQYFLSRNRSPFNKVWSTIGYQQFNLVFPGLGLYTQVKLFSVFVLYNQNYILFRHDLVRFLVDPSVLQHAYFNQKYC